MYHNAELSGPGLRSVSVLKDLSYVKPINLSYIFLLLMIIHMTQVIVFFCISSQWACCSTFSYLARAYCSSCSLLQKPCTFPSSNCIDLLWGNVIHVIYGGYFICYMCSSSSISNMLTAACLWIYWFTGSSKSQYSTKKSPPGFN